MKQSMTLIPTLRDVPADAEIKSHQLLLQAGFMRQNASGIYSYLPLGLKVLQKIEQIVREEMNAIGGAELLMPALQPAELWQQSGRWDTYGPELMRFTDRHKRDFTLGPTHEEVITSLVRDEIKSYRRLPLILYQIQTKFRDEKRPRFGLLRGREFVMKDAYSFHSNDESLDEVYEKMYQAYSNIFTRCKLNFRSVIADSGAMGGTDTHEFMVLSEVGEDTIAYSDESNYAANIEMAPVVINYEKDSVKEAQLEKVATEDKKTITEITSFLNVTAEQCIKSLLFKIDEKFVLVLVRGDHEVNEVKLKNLYEADVVELAADIDIETIFQCNAGSVGPIDVNNVEIIADNAVKAIVNGVCGANENGFHYINVNLERDSTITSFEDVRYIEAGDPSPDGQGTIRFAKGIEVGHIFKLGTRYSETMAGLVLDENGRNKPMVMGCYGIGVSRLIAAVAEQYHDDFGLVWPKELAPYDIHLVPVNMKSSVQQQLADEIYAQLKDARFDVLYDDRQERPGVKFTDSELIGLPIRIIVGKRASEQIVEVKVRKTNETFDVAQEDLITTIAEIYKKL